MSFPEDLRPGDFCGYALSPGEPFYDVIIADAIMVKTGGFFDHCELYLGDGKSFASRNGIGVNIYPFRPDGLAIVRRPNQLLDLEEANIWANSVLGESYDWLGLLNFFEWTTHVTPNKLFCSATATIYYWKAKFNAVNPECAANKISPFDYYKLPGFTTTYIDQVKKLRDLSNPEVVKTLVEAKNKFDKLNNL